MKFFQFLMSHWGPPAAKAHVDLNALIQTVLKKDAVGALAMQLVAMTAKVLPQFREKRYYDHGFIASAILDFLAPEFKQRFAESKLRHVVICGIHFYQQVDALLKHR